MECIVKGGFGLLEDLCSNFSNPLNCNNSYNNCKNNVASSASSTPTASSVAGEDFFVDQLLNLNNGEEEEYDQQQIDNNNTNTSSVVLVVKNEQNFQQQEERVDNQTLTSSPFLSPSFDSVLSLPTEEADLEWLSQFVEESFSQFSTPYPPGYLKPKPRPRPRPKHELLPEGPFLTPLNLSKSRRSKRARTGGRVWSTTVSDPSSPSTISPGSPTTPELDPPKKQKKKDIEPSGGPPRRCSHCGVQKTPQWRAGPMGAKTLCNACGVRYKSGRLLPEYRPACSPTFSSELYSNSHRKVLEMRRKKEMVTGQPESGSLSHQVSSFG